MASDLKFNGQMYDGRIGSNVYGTFYREVKPPDFFNGLNTGMLHHIWGSRMAEMSGRVRGLSAIGTLENVDAFTVVATTIRFPDGYFNNIPIVEVNYIPNKHPFKKINQRFLEPLQTPGIVWNNSYFNPSKFTVTGIGTFGFTLTHNQYIYGTSNGPFLGEGGKTRIYVWQAFGV